MTLKVVFCDFDPALTAEKKAAMFRRIKQRCAITDADCWIYTGKRAKSGYSRIEINNRDQSGHRIMWILAHGRIPEGMLVLHRCDVRSCVNPKHLFIGTQQDNIDDQLLKGRHSGQQKTHCANGHPFEPPHLMYAHGNKGKLKRVCRTCRRKHERERYARDRSHAA